MQCRNVAMSAGPFFLEQSQFLLQLQVGYAYAARIRHWFVVCLTPSSIIYCDADCSLLQLQLATISILRL